MMIGYARVSTQVREPDLWPEALSMAACKKIFMDTFSGSRDERHAPTKTLEMLSAGDALAVRKPERHGGSIKNLVDRGSERHRKGVQFKSRPDAIDTGAPCRRFFVRVMVSLAETGS